jgi:hypothetical protein
MPGFRTPHCLVTPSPPIRRSSSQVLGVLGGHDDQRAVENELVLSLGFEHFELIKELIKNRCVGERGWAAGWRGTEGAVARGP